ncbi:MAG: competence/damage-inducible protein A [Legionellaceae bacterium]|nr:competence/damage-inducible protein A [Legionellaceae bacterium]
MTIGLLATGDELTHGDTLNTSSQLIARALSSEGMSMGMHVVCGDKERELVDALEFLGKKHQVIMITGGLGPTSDDRTRFALARYLNQALIEFDDALNHVEARLARAKLLMNDGNRQQALFPEGATLFPNAHGTAMGCAYRQGEQLFVLLPGPPNECMPMFQAYALPLLRKQIDSSKKELLTWRLFDVAEGQIAEVLEHALAGISCQLGYCLETPYLMFKVRCNACDAARVRSLVEPLIAPYLLTSTLLACTASAQLSALLKKLKVDVTIVDEATGGMLQSLLHKPCHYAYLSFQAQEDKVAAASGYFYASGPRAYWQGASDAGSSDVVLRYRVGEHHGEERYTLSRIGAWTTHTAAEWLCARIFDLINQGHDFMA